ncbi:MAG: DUF4221 family protein [Algoriphagus sp.]|uniref:DUF4221 family protein n=1 Tax=Algoriphagus sp. TaxID=1872435 RepID=UPI003269E5D1
MTLDKNTISIVLLLSLMMFSCSDKEIQDEGECNSSIEVSQFEQVSDLDILAPDNFGGAIRSSYLYQDSLLYVLADKPKMKIKIIDLRNRQFIGEVPLDPNFFDFPSGIQVVSKDSIFVSDFHFPSIHLINSGGELLDTYNLYVEDLWEMPMEGFSNFGLYGGFGMDFEYIPDRNSFIIPLRQQDQWYFTKEKKDFPAIGEFSLATKEFVQVFGKYEGMYASEENYLLPFYLSHPIVERVGDFIVLSFSMDPNLYLYSLEGEYLGEKCGSIPSFILGEPLRYDMNDFDQEGIMNYNKFNSYYGDFFYVAKAVHFVRMYWECEKGLEGECKSKKAFAMIFDSKLNLLEVKETDEVFEGNAFMHQIPFEQGFLSKLSDRSSDDQFIMNRYYSIF